MLVFAHKELIEKIYGIAETLYPELKDEIIVMDYTNYNYGVHLLIGTEEDEGKYKIAINPSDDELIIASLFISGLSMLVYKLKYNKDVHPIYDEVNDTEYKNIYSSISTHFLPQDNT